MHEPDGSLITTNPHSFQDFTVANTLSGLVPTLYEALDVVSRELIGMIPAVQRDNGNFARAAKGQTVTVFITPTVTAADITPGVTAPNDGDQVLGSVSMTIGKSRYVPIRWNGEEQLGLNNNGSGFRPILVNQFAQAFRALGNEMENDLAARAYQAASRATGTPGTAPFGTSGDLSGSAATNQILDDNGTPVTDRHLVINSSAMANIRGKQSVLFKVNESGTEDLLRRGTIGELEGFNIHYSNGIKPVVAGTGAGFVTTAAYAVGATSIALGTGTGTVLAGDAITFAGDANVYMVTAGTSGPGTITIGAPGLRTAIATSTAMTTGASYTPNIAFSRNSMVLATRMPAVPIDMNGNQIDMADDRTMVVDPFSGIGFEVALYRQYRQLKYEVGLAWGTAAIKPEDVAILRG